MLLARFDDHRILCVTREHPGTGAEAICDALHGKVLAETGAKGAFLAGEPVMMQRNDYDRQLWNGDQGVVLRVADAERGGVHLMAVFARKDGLAAFPLVGLKADIRLSYAITVHKAQGSEYGTVAVVLPDVDVPILGREILYTAVTRARRSVVILGRRDLLALACGRVATRHSGVAARLEEVLYKPTHTYELRPAK